MTARENSIKTSVIGEAALMMARIYKQHVYPAKYERVFYMDGTRVLVLIEQYKRVDDTQPMSRRRVDEDDGIED